MWTCESNRSKLELIIRIILLVCWNRCVKVKVNEEVLGSTKTSNYPKVNATLGVGSIKVAVNFKWPRSTISFHKTAWWNIEVKVNEKLPELESPQSLCHLNVTVVWRSTCGRGLGVKFSAVAYIWTCEWNSSKLELITIILRVCWMQMLDVPMRQGLGQWGGVRSDWNLKLSQGKLYLKA